MPRPRALILLVLLVALALGACSEDGVDDGDGAVAPTTTAAESTTTSGATSTTAAGAVDDLQAASICEGMGRRSSPATFDPSTGSYAAYVKEVLGTKATFDVVQWLAGEDAAEAYREDQGSDDGDTPPNDYWIRNASTQVRSAEIDPAATVSLVRLPADGTPTVSPGTVDELPRYVAEDQDPVYWLTFERGKVTMVCEQYTP